VIPRSILWTSDTGCSLHAITPVSSVYSQSCYLHLRSHVIRLRRFSISLLDEAKRWFESSATICRYVPDGANRGQKVRLPHCAPIIHVYLLEDHGHLQGTTQSLCTLTVPCFCLLPAALTCLPYLWTLVLTCFLVFNHLESVPAWKGRSAYRRRSVLKRTLGSTTLPIRTTVMTGWCLQFRHSSTIPKFTVPIQDIEYVSEVVLGATI